MLRLMNRVFQTMLQVAQLSHGGVVKKRKKPQPDISKTLSTIENRSNATLIA
jgi:hypothetical protein